MGGRPAEGTWRSRSFVAVNSAEKGLQLSVLLNGRRRAGGPWPHDDRAARPGSATCVCRTAPCCDWLDAHLPAVSRPRPPAPAPDHRATWPGRTHPVPIAHDRLGLHARARTGPTARPRPAVTVAGMTTETTEAAATPPARRASQRARAAREVNEASGAAPSWPRPAWTSRAADPVVPPARDRQPPPRYPRSPPRPSDCSSPPTRPCAPRLGRCFYSVKDHPRREWSSPGFGNRRRAARMRTASPHRADLTCPRIQQAS